MSYYVRVSVTCVLLIMHNYHVIYVLIYYSGIRVKNLNSGLKNTLCLYCVTGVLLIMHNYHVIYVLIYYSGIRVKNLNIFWFEEYFVYYYYYCVLLTCINTMHYCVLCIIIEYYYC